MYFHGGTVSESESQTRTSLYHTLYKYIIERQSPPQRAYRLTTKQETTGGYKQTDRGAQEKVRLTAQHDRQ